MGTLTLTGRNKVTKRGSDYDRAVENGYLGNESDWLNTTKNSVVSVYTVQKNFIRDLRRDTYQTLDLVIHVENLTGNLTITHDAFVIESGAVLSDAYFLDSLGVQSQSVTMNITQDTHDTSYKFCVNYSQPNTNAETISINAVIGVFNSQEKISMIDQTESYRYLGHLTAIPTGGTYLNCDSFVLDDSTSEYDGRIYVYSASSGQWELMSQAGLSSEMQSYIASLSMHDILRDIPPDSVEKSEYGYFDHIITGIVTADYVGSKQIRVQESSGGEEGYIYGHHSTDGNVRFRDGLGNKIPAGQRASGKAFVIDSNGVAELSEGHARNLNVYDVLNLQNAQIRHPALSTYEGTVGDSTGVLFGQSGHDPATHWCSEDIFTQLTPYVQYTARTNTGGYVRFRGETLVGSDSSNNFIRIDSSDHIVVGEKSETYTFSSQSTETHTFKTSAPEFFGGGSVVPFRIRCVRRKISGAILCKIRIYSGNYNTFASYEAGEGPETIDITPTLDTYSLHYNGVSVEMQTISQPSTTSGTAYFHIDNVTCAVLGYTSAGLWKSYTKILSRDEYLNGTTEAWEMYNMKSNNEFPLYNSSEHINYCNPMSLINYTSYTYVDPDDQQTKTKTLELNSSYKVSGSVKIGGSLVATNILYFTRLSATQVRVTLEGLPPVFIDSSTYLYWEDGSMAISTIENGIEMMGQYPIASHTYDVGNPDRYWYTGYFDYLHGTISGSSLRALKEQIKPYERSGLDVINGTEIVSYVMKSDKEKLKRIGFIADDTDQDIASPMHDRMMYDSCIGVLMKAVQELSAKVDSLEQRLSQLN